MTQTRRRNPRPRSETPPEPEPDADPDAEPDAPPEPEPEPEPEPDSIEAQARKIDNARRKYRKDLTGIIGDLEGASDCPYCDGMGLVPDEAVYLKREDVDACTTCAGKGFMFTGSSVAEHRLLPCPTCSGTGYRPKTAPPPENVHTLPVQPPLPAQQVHGWLDPTTGQFHSYGEQAAPE